MHILVTGGAGFIGSHLCEALLRAGHNVTCLDNFSTGRRENIANLTDLNIIEADVNEEATWKTLSGRSFDVIFYYAALVGVKRTEENPLAVLKDTQGLYYLTQFAKKEKVRKIIFSSSSEVYGQTAVIPTPELEGNKAWSPYTTVKLYGEHLLHSLWKHDGIPTVCLRFFNVYGPRQNGSDYGFVVGKFIEQATAGEAPTVFGDGQQTRDFVYIDDNIQAALVAMDSTAANGQIINIGTGRETTVSDLAYAVIEAAGRRGKISPVNLPARQIEISRRCAATDKMTDLLGVECKTGLAPGLEQTITSFTLAKSDTAVAPAVA